VQRLEALRLVVEVLCGVETPMTVHAWFLGLNPLLDDTPPAR